MDLKEKQEKGLGILLEIDRICEKHQISYRLDAGTLLGAIRHKGFIPWDDDVDLCFLREDWEKFSKVAQEELPANFALLLPDTFRGGKAFYDFRQQLIFGLAMGHRRMVNLKKYKGLSRLFVSVLSKLGRLFSMPYLFSLQDAWAQAEGKRRKMKARRKAVTSNLEKEERFLYFSNYQPDFQYCISRYSWEKPLLRAKFENYSLPIPKGYDALLRMLYGRYEMLPKKENRVPAHEEMI